MLRRLSATASLFALIFAASTGAPSAAESAAPAPLIAHRAAYAITLADSTSPSTPSAQTPIAARGLIAYEFQGSACEGYASNFREVTELERSEGDPVSAQTNSVTFEDGDGKSMRFQIDSQGFGDTGPVAGLALRAANGDVNVKLTKPQELSVDIGPDVLFPTQHVVTLIAQAKAGGGTMTARVYDGSDTGTKIYDTLSVIGKEATTASDDAAASAELAKVRRWPVTISYFNAQAKDSLPEYTESFDLYENGVSGSLKLDYGTFALQAKLSKIEFIPSRDCPK